MSSIAVVTGAAGDIGRAIALRLADSHDIVVLVDIDVAAAEKAARDLGTAERFVALGCDVTSEAPLVLSACMTRTAISGARTMR